MATSRRISLRLRSLEPIKICRRSVPLRMSDAVFGCTLHSIAP